MKETGGTVRDDSWEVDSHVPSSIPLSPGDRLGAYVVIRLIGRGAIGLVYLAEDSQTKVQVAIKILRPDWERAFGDDYGDLFRKEAVVHQSLRHPQIVKLLGSGEHDSLPYHVFEYIDGPTLGEFSGTRTVDSIKAARIIADVADAIQYSHRCGVVHRDLKPSNILLDQQGRAHVADFGIALEHSELGTGSSFVGTPLYMSPEQVRGSSHHLDGRSDIFSLGVILYQMTTGIHPFLPPNASQDTLKHSIENIPAPPLRQRADVPREFDRICMKALAKDPMDRFNTAGDFAMALRRYSQRGWRRELWVLAACTSLLLAGAMVVYWNRNQVQTQPTNFAMESDDSTTERIPSLPVPAVSQADLASMDTSIAALLPNGVSQASPQEVDLAAALIVARLKVDANLPPSLWEHFGSGTDNTLQTALIHLCSVAGLDPQRLIDQALVEQRPDIRAALLLAVGEYSDVQLPLAARSAIAGKVLEWYCYQPQAAMHSVCGWLLRHWGEDTDALNLQNQRGFRAPSEQREWLEILPNISMIACYPHRSALDGQSTATATAEPLDDFAISTFEITEAQWDWVMGDASNMPNNYAALPKTGVSWHQCAGFCNRLSEIMGLPDGEKCYEALPNNYYREVAEAHLRGGFRMPTLAEWDYAARAGTSTDRYWGRAERYLPKYANCRPRSFLMPIAGGLRKPNGIGLFDTLGNATEWIHDTTGLAETQPESLALRHIRGGSAWTIESGVTVDAEYTMAANLPSDRMGLRIVQRLIKQRADVGGLTVELQTSDQHGMEIEGQSSPTETLRLAISSPSSPSSSPKLGVGQFLGRFQRGASIPRTLVVKNSSSIPVMLTSVTTSGCLRLLEEFALPQPLLPGESVQLPAAVESTGTTLQAGGVTLHTNAEDGVGEESSYPLNAYFSGPSIVAMEGGLDGAGSIRFDFGKVQPGTLVRQLVSLMNVGDQPLIISTPVAKGAICLSRPATSHQLAHRNHAFIEFELSPSSVGGVVVGSLEFETNDPSIPQVRIEAAVEAANLPMVPVFCVYRRGLWLLDYNRDGRPERTIEFGEAGDRPFVGDFDGDGAYELGVYRRVDNQRVELTIRTTSAGGHVNESTRSLQVPAGDLVIGDFDGNGRSDIGWVSLGEAGLLKWQIDINGDGLWDQTHEYGFPGDVPLAGDWLNTGRDNLGVYRQNLSGRTASHWFLRNDENVPESTRPPFGLINDQPVTGDWNGDGKADFGVYRIVNGVGTFLLDLDLDSDSESFLELGTEGDIALTFMAPPF